MIFKIRKLFLNLASSYKLIVINILLVAIFLSFSESAFSNDMSTEKNLAYKYCKSLESNMFEGLDNERILKFEYFFNAINKEGIDDERKIVRNLTSEVEKTCSYKLKSEEEDYFRTELKKYLFNNLN